MNYYLQHFQKLFLELLKDNEYKKEFNKVCIAFLNILYDNVYHYMWAIYIYHIFIVILFIVNFYLLYQIRNYLIFYTELMRNHLSPDDGI